jgi:cytochrome c oxidase subunit 2
MAMNRRTWLLQTGLIASACTLGLAARRVLAQSPAPEQLVKLVAQRFHYTPNELRVKAGVPVLLELSALDFVHGFNLPDLKLRADLPPGRVVQLRFTLDKPGNYDFLCDNFCGDEHETMNGRIIALAA